MARCFSPPATQCRGVPTTHHSPLTTCYPMFPPFLSLLSVAVITLAAYGLGRPVLRGLNLADDDRLTAGVWSIAVGLVLAGTLLAILGLVGLLYRPLIGVLSTVGCFWGIGPPTFIRTTMGNLKSLYPP